MRDIHHLAINLRRSEDRWAAILAAAENHGIDLRRVDAVDGRDHDIADWHDFDVGKFERCNGRVPMPGEFGCYRSHVRALRTFLDSDAGSAVILEDDAIPNGHLVPFTRHLARQFGDRRCLVRLTSHRRPLFEKLRDGAVGVLIGQCRFGPTGSAAAYWVSRPAAERLLETMLPGYLAVDVMLERSWETGVTALMVKPDLLPVRRGHSTIVPDGGYAAGKFPRFRRIGALRFRTRQSWDRAVFCMRNGNAHSDPAESRDT